MNFFKKKDEQKDTASSVGKRRKFLSGAAGAGAVALGFPMIATGQATPIAMYNCPSRRPPVQRCSHFPNQPPTCGRPWSAA